MAQLQGPSLPDFVYWIIGVMVVANLGTIISVVIIGFKVVWWVSKLDSRVIQNKVEIDQAHSHIRQLQGIEEY